MANNVSKLSGTQPSQRQRSVLKALIAALCATSLAGCVTTGMTATDLSAQCGWTRAITYSSKHDTKPTVQQIQVHNRAGQRLGCWK